MRHGVAGDGLSPRLGFEVVCFVVLAVAAYGLLRMNVLEGQRSGRLEFV